MELKFILESLLFTSQKPLSTMELSDVLNRAADEEGAEEGVKALKKLPPEQIDAELQVLAADHEAAQRSYRLVCVAGSWQFVTESAFAPWLRTFIGVKSRPSRLSQPALETLAIIAYRQPITRPEIDDIRGVDCGPVLKVLLERDLVRILGKKDEPGRPILYGTTTAFLELFGLKNIKDLPTLKEFTELNEDSKRTVEKELGESIESVQASLARDAEAALNEAESQTTRESVSENASENGNGRGGENENESKGNATRKERENEIEKIEVVFFFFTYCQDDSRRHFRKKKNIVSYGVFLNLFGY
jgi:segregation and condensation protein B